jgi:hypothetical protein
MQMLAHLGQIAFAAALLTLLLPIVVRLSPVAGASVNAGVMIIAGLIAIALPWDDRLRTLLWFTASSALATMLAYALTDCSRCGTAVSLADAALLIVCALMALGPLEPPSRKSQ